MILKFGSKGDAVATLQKRLNTYGHKLNVDGDFGQGTENAVIAFQKSKGLVADGIVGDKTNAALTGSDTSKFLTDADYIAAAKRLEVPELVIRAFAETESRSGGFLTDGRPAILFERHRMYLYLTELTSKANATTQMAKYPNIVNTVSGGYKGGTAEYTRLALAKGLNERAALQSCSWGQFQIMGDHWKDLGYQSVNEFVNGMYQSEKQQLEAFIRFIEWKKGTIDKKTVTLHDALKAQDWHTVFTLYNGSAYKKLGYDSKFQQVMNRLEPIYGNKAA